MRNYKTIWKSTQLNMSKMFKEPEVEVENEYIEKEKKRERFYE